MLLVHSSDLFLLNILLEVRPLDMTPVEQLGDDSWQVVFAALCHMALVFAIKHLYFFIFFFKFCNVFIHSFFILFFNLVSIN